MPASAARAIMAAGLDVILGDPQVKSVFVNVFGGITSCVAGADGKPFTTALNPFTQSPDFFFPQPAMGVGIGVDGVGATFFHS